MAQQRTIFPALLCLLMLSPQSVFAAAWTLSPHQWEFYQNFFYYRTTEYFDASGHLRSQPPYTKYEYNPYLEYGWREGTTLGGSVGIAKVNGETMPSATVTLRGDNYGLSDPTVFLRQRLWQNDTTVLSVQPLLKLPSYYSNRALPQSGTSQTDAELRLLGGHGFMWLGQHHFINLEAAYRKRMGEPGDQLRFDTTLGISLSDAWQILPQLSLIEGINRASSSAFTQSNEDDYNLIKPQISAVYRWNERVALQAGLFDHSLGNNTGAGSGVMFSVWYKP